MEAISAIKGFDAFQRPGMYAVRAAFSTVGHHDKTNKWQLGARSGGTFPGNRARFLQNNRSRPGESFQKPMGRGLLQHFDCR